MKAALLRATDAIENDPLELVDLPEPVPGPGEVSLTVLACGVCRSNLHMVEGDWLPATPSHFPIVPGHEVVGRVRALGPGVENLAIGDRVGVQPIWSTCGLCELCVSGRDHLCHLRQITGETRDGGYAEVMLAYAAHAYLIPDSLTDAEAAPLMCPGVTAFGAVKKAKLSSGSRAAVIGVGGVGHMALQMALLTGAEVIAITRGEAHSAVARELGASSVFTPAGTDGAESAPDGYVDAALVFAPSHAAIREAYRITKRGGVIVVGVSVDVGFMDIGDEKRFETSVLASRSETREMLALAGQGRFRVIHEDFALEQANAVLTALKNGRVRARAVLVP